MAIMKMLGNDGQTDGRIDERTDEDDAKRNEHDWEAEDEE